jgi:flagellar hook-associated protein 3 FlgL
MTGIGSSGDAAQFHRFRQDGALLRQEMQRLTAELSTGRHADTGRALGGDFRAVADLSHRIQLHSVFARTIAEAGIDAQGRQAALERVEAELDGLAPHLLGMATGGSLQDMTLSLADAPDRFAQAVAALNTRVADKALFAGDAPDRAALVSAETMLEALRPLARAAPDAAAMIATVEAWFLDPGDGFDTLAWQGGAGPAAPAILGEGQQEQAGITARDPALREVLAGLALAALAAEEAGPGPAPIAETERRALVRAGAMRLDRGEDALIRLRSDLGASQARIEAARVAAEAARSSAEIDLAHLTGADPYRTATDLQSVQTRLEQLYILTARLSRLTLSEYLR